MTGRSRSARSVTAVLVLGLTAAFMTSCGGDGEPRGGDGLSVVAAFYPIEEVVNRIGGDLVTVTGLTPPGSEPHDLELKPSDVTNLRRADLVLYLGGGFQPAIEDAIGALPKKESAIDLLRGLPLLTSAPDEHDDEAGSDPHVWLSPVLLADVSEAIAAALVERLTEHRADIEARAAALAGDLDELDAEFASGLERCERREIVTSHAAFGYLARQYDLEQIAITGVSPEAEPSSKRLQAVAAEARKHGATTIFFETLVDPRVSKAVARIVGAQTAVLDPIEGIAPDARRRGADYFSVMRDNLRALQGALGCRP